LLKRTGTIVTTLGEMGSRIRTQDRQTEVPVVKAKEVVDPTGAGDAYRAGLIKGLIRGENMERCALMGSVCASFAIERYGTQEYHFTQEQFDQRLDAAG
jgi:adenosine kinase